MRELRVQEFPQYGAADKTPPATLTRGKIGRSTCRWLPDVSRSRSVSSSRSYPSVDRHILRERPKLPIAQQLSENVVPRLLKAARVR